MNFKMIALKVNELKIIVYNELRIMHFKVTSFKVMLKVDFEDNEFLNNLKMNLNIIMIIIKKLNDNNINFNIV